MIAQGFSEGKSLERLRCDFSPFRARNRRRSPIFSSAEERRDFASFKPQYEKGEQKGLVTTDLLTEKLFRLDLVSSSFPGGTLILERSNFRFSSGTYANP